MDGKPWFWRRLFWFMCVCVLCLLYTLMCWFGVCAGNIRGVHSDERASWTSRSGRTWNRYPNGG